MEFEERLRDRQWSIKDGCSVAKLLDLLSTKTVFSLSAKAFSVQHDSKTSSSESERPHPRCRARSNNSRPHN